MKFNDIKIIFVDIDGTLTNSDKQITSKTKETIKKVTEKGIKVVLTSGRNYFYTQNKAKEANASEIVISSNGALIATSRENILNETISKKDLEKMIEFVKTSDLGLLCSSKNANYCNRELIFKYINDTKVVNTDELINTIPSQLVIIANEEKDYKNIQEVLKETNLKLAYISDSYKEKKEGYSIDLINKNVSKGAAIKKLLNYLNLNKKQTMCFGDYDNDLEMFKECNIKVAMENATEKLKKEATHITLTNDEDGVAIFLEKYILKGE